MPAPAIELNDTQRRDWLRLIKSENVGPATFRQLINRYGSARTALEALPERARRGGLSRPLRIYSERQAQADLERTARLGARFVALGEAGYPALLRHITYPPPLLCVKGNTDLLQITGMAIVGSRNASAMGRKFTRQIATGLGEAQMTVISGMARGIDTAAHEASLATGTIAVLAGGIDNIYPRENEALYHQIGETGVLVSEMTPGTMPRAEFFPRRNRIISGLALGVVVVEAAIRSGSLITARMAGEHGREVFAVPGSPLDPRAAGTNRLIRDGAAMVTGVNDILDAIEQLSHETLRQGGANQLLESDDIAASEQAGDDDPSTDILAQIISLLGPVPLDVDDLIRESGHSAQTISGALMELELAGRVQRTGHGQVSLA